MDLRPAQAALAAAKDLYEAHDYSKAGVQAKRASALAVTLNGRFTSYLASWREVQRLMEELRSIGYPIDAVEEALAAADTESARLVEEDGSELVNYVGATAILDRAARQARALVAAARKASRDIFLATLAVTALREPETPKTETWLAVRLDDLVMQATHELALGNLCEAVQLAEEARRHADSARGKATRAQRVLEEAEVVTEHVKAEGPVADRLEDRIGSIRDALVKGYVDSTTANLVADHVSNEAIVFADSYSRCRRVLEHAERVYARLQEEGFFSDSAEAALREARQALGTGDWTGVRENVRRASEAFVRRRRERALIAKAISDLEGRVMLLRDFRLPFLPDVEEILGWAKEEFESGRYSGANEDVLLANALMIQATRNAR